MDVYAGFLEIFDDTLIYYVIGDNGASAEGTLQGAFNEMANFNGMGALETPEFMRSRTRDDRSWTPPTSGVVMLLGLRP
jgi:hypothetical protein